MMRTPVFDWLYRRRRALGAVFREVESFGRWLPGVRSFVVKLRRGRTTFLGTGRSRDPLVALEKACAEAVEHAVVQHAGSGWPSSSGVAVHYEVKRARDNAAHELIERDAFMCHFLGRLPVEPWEGVERQLGAGGASFRTLRERLRAEGVSVRLGRLSAPARAPVFVCVAFGTKHRRAFGVSVGMGCKSTVSKAVEHAIGECLSVMLPALVGRQVRPLTVAQFARLKDPSIEAHERLALHPASAAKTSRRLFSDPTWRCRRLPVPGRFAFTRLALPDAMKGCPLVAVRCTNDALQQLFFGHPGKDLVNVERVQAFRAAHRLAPTRLQLEPHPFV